MPIKISYIVYLTLVT